VPHAVKEAAPDAALARPRAAARHEAAVLRAAARHEAAEPRAVPDAEEARAEQRAVQVQAEPARRGEQHAAARTSAALPLAGASAFRQDPVLPWPARRRLTPSVHAMWSLRTASPSKPWWRAARDEGVS
jgi:hypothetical protein